MSDVESKSNQSQRRSSDVNLDSKLEQEIEDALGDMSLEDMLDLGERPPSSGAARQLRSGTVVSVHGRDVMVEFGPKSQGLCPLEQFSKPPEIGSKMDFIVERFDANEGLLLLSREGAVARADWESLEAGQVVEGRCMGLVKGGLELMIGQHKAFMPASQVDLHFVKDISVLLNEKVTVEILKLDRKRGRMLVSRRNVLAAERERLRGELLGSLQVGKRVKAVITTIQPYGAFADIGGLDGLIHISDMSHQRINHPSEVVKEGDQVEVEITKIEEDPGSGSPRIGLSLKSCLADPFETTAASLAEGETVTGKITKIMPFGAFMEVAPGVEGLIHISQLSHERVNRVSQVVKPDEVVTAKILSVDPGTRRISLSLKALKNDMGSDESMSRQEDPALRKLKAQLSKKFGDNLKGGIG